MIRKSRFLAYLLGLVLAAALISPATAEASTNLWHCSPFAGGDTWACTTVQGAPSTGIQVLDRTTKTVVTWYNGTSVALWEWAIDTGSSCGVNGDHYVWDVWWMAGGQEHWGVLGDWWLATGSYADWSNYTDRWGSLSNDTHYAGTGSGTCNYFNPPPYGW